MNTPNVSRRRVLQGLGLAATAPVWIRYVEPAFGFGSSAAPAPRHLLVVYLQGGNDPLHTVAPIGDPNLLRLRPSVALRNTDVFAMDNGYGLNKNLPTLFNFWQAGQLAVIQQVGNMNATFSHTIATRQWETGTPDHRFNTGWLGRYLDATSGHGPIRATAFGDMLPLTLTGADKDALTLDSIGSFGFADYGAPDAAARHDAVKQFASAEAPAGSLLANLMDAQRQMVDAAGPITDISNSTIDGRIPTAADNAAQFFAAGIGTEIAFITLPSFDTHAGQRGVHTTSVSALETVTKNFFATATKLGVADSSAVVVFSEFGRRVNENRSEGTDHGDATDVFVVGPPVRGGMYGPTLDLTQLVDGNLPTRVDLRSVYASILDGWLRADPEPILGGVFPTMPLFRDTAGV
ncbi:MAG: hypothetical protein QOF21_461 [Actinomycetota bacterium]|jgi:uncharacterized protein (DUF1501 family)